MTEYDEYEALLASFVPPAWMKDAACREHDRTLFFPDRGDSTAAARAVCAGCLVRAECLDYAIENHIAAGIWGGMSGRDRRAIRKAS